MTEIDPDYLNGKIYLVKSLKSDKIYIGSTKNTLNYRWRGHKKDYNRDKGLGLYKDIVLDINEWNIELYENFPCNNKYELERREGEIQKSILCINKEIAGRTDAEWREDNLEQIRAKGRLANMTEEKKEKEKERARYRNENMTPARIERNRAYGRIENMTPEKLEKERERGRAKYHRTKQAKSVENNGLDEDIS